MCVNECVKKYIKTHIPIHTLTHTHRCASSYIVSYQAAYKMLNGGKVPFGLRNIDPYMENLMNSTLPDVYWVEPPLVRAVCEWCVVIERWCRVWCIGDGACDA